MKSRPSVSAVIVTYNSAQHLHSLLRSLLDNIHDCDLEIIVVDNDSADQSYEIVSREYPSIRLIRRGINGGYGSGCNDGAKQAKGDYLLFVNSDITVQTDPLPVMINRLRVSREIGIVGCQLRNPDGTIQPSVFRWPGLLMRMVQLLGLKYLLLKFVPSASNHHHIRPGRGFVSGGFLLIPRELFNSLGGFDERYFMYLEDADLCYRAGKLNRLAVLVDAGNVIHSGRHYENLENPFVFFHSNRGQIIFYKTHYPAWKWCVLVSLTLLCYSVRLIFLNDNIPRAEQRRHITKVLRLYMKSLFAIPDYRS